jgi:hypothetical protein
VTSDAPITIEERYGQAITAKRLKVNRLRITDVDLLIAAGCVESRYRGNAERALAPLLLRLHVEWDGVKGDHALALRRQIQLEEAIKSAAKEVSRLMLSQAAQDKEVLEQKIADLEALRDQAKREAISEQALMLSKLRTLESARDALFRWATIEASKFPLQGLRLPAEPRRRQGETDEQLRARHQEWHRRVTKAAQQSSLSDKAVAAITGRVLRSWLNPRCGPCCGVGSVLQSQPRVGKKGGKDTQGAYGSALQMKCRFCRGTGLVRESLGETDVQRRFAGHMLDRMSEMLGEVEREMRRFLHAQGG